MEIIIWGIRREVESGGKYLEYSYGEHDMKYRKAKLCFDDTNDTSTAYIRIKGNKKYYVNKYFKRHDVI